MLDLNSGHQLRVRSPIYNKMGYITRCFTVCDSQSLHFLQIFPNVFIILKKKNISEEHREVEQEKRRENSIIIVNNLTINFFVA